MPVAIIGIVIGVIIIPFICYIIVIALFFLNFCLNYDGQEELVDALKLINRQVLAGKLSPENITGDTIKENLYTSYFISPDLMIKNSESRMDTFFLWDCVGAKRHFTGQDFPEFSKSDFEKVLSK